MPGIKGFLETSFIDWPGRTCAMFFLGGCNLRCPFCHNHQLVLEAQEMETLVADDLLARLSPWKKWLGGICVSGGEPTLDPELPDLLRRMRVAGWPVKLDTNGTRPEVLGEVLAAGLVDAVAMDVKAPLVQKKYDRCAGVAVDLEAIRASIGLLRRSGVAHQFRMTVVPALHSEADIVLWAATLEGSRRTLQNFNPVTTLDSSLEAGRGFSPDVFENMQRLVA
jgi:pyruvate formate lyase activating enzyme